jgi:hypothetical protein
MALARPLTLMATTFAGSKPHQNKEPGPDNALLKLISYGSNNLNVAGRKTGFHQPYQVGTHIDLNYH